MEGTIPAELEFARRGASHMHASLVFLYWPFAFWTRLRISQYPEMIEHNMINLFMKLAIRNTIIS